MDSILLAFIRHSSGVLTSFRLSLIHTQPLNNQKADCFRLVLAGKKKFGIEDIYHVLDTMEKYGANL